MKKLTLMMVVVVTILSASLLLYLTKWQPTKIFQKKPIWCAGGYPCPPEFRCVYNNPQLDMAGVCVREGNYCGGARQIDCPRGYYCQKEDENEYSAGQCIKNPSILDRLKK